MVGYILGWWLSVGLFVGLALWPWLETTSWERDEKWHEVAFFAAFILFCMGMWPAVIIFSYGLDD